MHRSKTADYLLHQLAVEKGAELLILSEQYRNKESTCWCSDLLGTAAIWIPNREVHVESHGAGRGFVWVKSHNVTYFSCYFTPNEVISDFRNKLDALEDEILRVTGSVVVAGDLNARALEWGMPHTDSRGRLILETAARIGLLVLNSGSTTTFRRPGYTETIPDITLASEGLVPLIQGWRVLEDFTASDHQYITFQIGEVRQSRLYEIPLRWNLLKINVERFERKLAKGTRLPEVLYGDGRHTTEALVASTMCLITSACEASMPRKKPRHGKPPIYWWTPEISDLRKRCLMLRRKAQRAKSSAEANLRSPEYKAAKKELRRAINRSKGSCWRTLVDDIDRDPWGLGYKIVTKRLGAQKPTSVMDSHIMETIVATLFPSHPERAATEFRLQEEIPLFSEEELDAAVLSTKNRKAPGPDGIPNEVLKMVYRQDPSLLLRMYNSCLAAGVFSSRWKCAKLVLINKGKGDPELPSSYRPLCMLDTAGKVLEKLIRARLTAAIKAAGDLSPKQYGFRVGLSTVDAIQEVVGAVRRAEQYNHLSKRIVLLVTLDVKNAFNSASWGDMLGALEQSFRVPEYLMRILHDYLRDRTLIYDTEGGKRMIAVTAGAAQGSVLGPDLWNASYDSLLRAEMPDETHLVGYADDIAVLIAARDTKHAQLKLNQVMRTVMGWMSEHGLSIALQKTEIVILTKKRMQASLPMWVGDEVVETKPAAKYLGLVIDSKMTFFEQIKKTAEKASKGVMALSRLMANVGGPKSGKRRLLMSAVQSVLLYGAEIWADSLEKDMYRKRLSQVQRRSALRVASAYRTVSEAAILVIAGCIPIHLLAKERKAIYTRKSETSRKTASLEERCRTLEIWQEAWERETKGRWTARLIKQVGPWLERTHGEVGYYLTQFLSGHGYFRSYLFRMRKVTSAECLYCPGSIDDVEHTFFTCDAWEEQRAGLEVEVGAWSPETAVDVLLHGVDRWVRVSQFIEGILREKKVDLDRFP
jgi:hypothetical protein